MGDSLRTSTVEAPVLPVERFTGRWLRMQQAQLALKTAAGAQASGQGDDVIGGEKRVRHNIGVV